MIGLIPLPWKIGGAAVLVGALIAGHMFRVKAADNAGYARAVSQRAVLDAAAIMTRAKENAAIAAQHDAINAKITKGKNNEIAILRARLAAERMRKPAFCNEPAGSPDAQSAGIGHGAGPASGLLPDRVAADIQALILKTEEAAATARACQAFVRGSGLAP